MTRTQTINDIRTFAAQTNTTIVNEDFESDFLFFDLSAELNIEMATLIEAAGYKVLHNESDDCELCIEY